MESERSEVDWQYRNLLLIWSALVAAGPLMLLCIYLIDPSAVFPDLSQPFIGEHYILIPAAIFLAVLDLFLAYSRHKQYLRQAIIDRNTELVQTALILAGACTESLSVYGFCLWFFYSYPYFLLWIVVGVVATTLLFPRRSQLQDVRHATD